MTTFILFLLMAGTAVIAGYLVLGYLKKLTSRPVLQINLSPVEKPKWRDESKIEGLIYSFNQKGFEPAGHYECLEIPSLIISGFAHPSQQMSGVIYDHPIQGIWVDIFVQYNDGGSLTVSNAPAGDEVDHMPNQTKIYSKRSSLDELFERVLTETRKTGRITISKEEFASHFEEQYKKEMKWRIDQGGPKYLEVRRVMGGSTDRERLEKATHQLQANWEKESKQPTKVVGSPFIADLPDDFQRPEEFRAKLEKQSGSPPRLSVPALPVYLFLVSAMVYWVYYGYQYNQTHFPVSICGIIFFFAVFLVPFLTMIGFRELRRRVRLYPLLKRIAGMRPGAFLIMDGTSPVLFYARNAWIGMISFEQGSEHKNAFTRMDARVNQRCRWLEISRKNILGKVILGKDKDVIELPESDFSRRFKVSSTEPEFARQLLEPAVTNAIMQLDKLGKPFLEFEGSRVRVEVGSDLSGPYKEDKLRRFLENAEDIIEKASNAS